MVFYVCDSNRAYHACDMQGYFAGATAMLVGGSPSLRSHDLSLLEKRGVVSFAMNNTGALFRPTCMACCDQPRCFDMSILTDPTIMKFALLGHASKPIRKDSSVEFRDLPGTFFYQASQESRDSAFGTTRSTLDWKRNTLFVSLEIMINLGIRRIVLAGSDFGRGGRIEGQPSASSGPDYAHGSSLTDSEKVWNSVLYKYEAFDLRKMKDTFDRLGVELVDSSDSSKIAGDMGPYRKVTFEEGIEMCLERYRAGADPPGSLPHCSRLYPKKMIEKVVSGRYSVVDEKQVLEDVDNVKMTAVPPGVEVV